jgi:hypothetical protein
MAKQVEIASPDTRDFMVYTIRLPLDLAAAIRAEAERRFEPQSVLVRRLVRLGLREAESEQL